MRHPIRFFSVLQIVARAFLRAVFRLFGTPRRGTVPGVHTSVNAARRNACATLALLLTTFAAHAQQIGQNTQPGGAPVTFTAGTQLVIETVAVKDKQGNPV